MENNDMRVTKRSGDLEEISFDKILARIKKICQEVNIKINYQSLAMKVIDQLYDTISTTKIDELAAEQCASLSTLHHDYATIASRILISNHQKNTDSSFSTIITKLYNFIDIHNNHNPLVSKDLYNFTTKYSDALDSMIKHERDYLLDYFGFKTLERAYLLKIHNKIVERPQHMWLRVSIGIHYSSTNFSWESDEKCLSLIKETYDLMSLKYFTHATPTLFNAGTPRPQLSSCYLIALENDSLDGIYNTLKDCAIISKYAGGIGLHIHNVRAKGSHIHGTNGKSNGIVPMLRVFNNTARYVDQCLDPNTIVYTKNGPTAIKNIVIGDKVITDDGNMYSIRKVLDYEYFGDVYKLDIKHSLHPLIATDMHPLWVIKNNVQYNNFNDIIGQLERNLINPEFIEIKNILNNDFVGFSIPKYEKDISHYNEDDCRMYGILLGNGILSSNNNLVYLLLNKETNKDTISFVEDYLSKINISIAYNDIDDNNVQLNWHRNNMFKFTYEMIYDVNKEKHMINNMLHLSKNKILNIIKGVLEINGLINEQQIDLEFTSQSIVEGLRYMLLRLSILTSGTEKIKYILTLPKTQVICDLFTHQKLVPSETFTFFEYNGFLFSIVDKNELIKDYCGRVIDIEVDNEEHHNFLTHNGLVKNGGGKRNGSFAIYLEPWHADILDFLEMKKNHGDEDMKARDLFYALWISDLFMERVKEKNGKWTLFCPHECPGLSDVYGVEFKQLYEKYEESGKARKTISARELWFAILDSQMETGTPYLLYKDTANHKSNQKNLGTIKSSNLCVAPETLILTDKGHIEIQSLENQQVNVWNGESWSSVTVKKTGEDQELIDIYTDDGLMLTCTPYHKFYIQDNNSIVEVQAKDLKPDDKLIKCDYPIIDGCETMPYAYTHGFFCGDGTYTNITNTPERQCKFKALPKHYFCKRHIAYETELYLLEKDYLLDEEDIPCQAKSYAKKPIAYLYGNKTKLLEHLEVRSHTISESSNRINVTLPVDLNEKYDVPSHFCSIKDKLDWFAGYCDADGCIAKNGDNEQLQIASIHKKFLENILLMLQTCGINGKIKLNSNREKSYLPDGKGGYKFFNVKPIYRLLITSYDLYNLYALGFRPKRLIVSGNKPARDAKQFIKILKIENNNRIDDTYCFTEPKKHMGIFNGILTGQCSEIIEYSDDKETAVCNLASIALPSFVDGKTFNFNKLYYVTGVITNNLNKVIDINFYPTEKTKRSNFRHRPIGIGVQGLADMFILLDIPYHSEEAKALNKKIFETIYHSALTKSNELSIERGKLINTLIENDAPRSKLLEIINEHEYSILKRKNKNWYGAYESFEDSPASNGILQFDMWNITPNNTNYNWQLLKQNIQMYGIRNSLLIAPMPTASTSQILGYNECFEPLTSNLYTRKTLAGEFVVVNKYLMKELIELGQWNEQIKNNIVANKGSIQQLTNLSQHIRDKYKIAWEIPMKHLIDMAADRGAYICQSQSLNLWMEDPVYNKLTSMHFYAWEKGLKTGIYYLRRKAKHQAQQFTIEPELNKQSGAQEEICEMCSA